MIDLRIELTPTLTAVVLLYRHGTSVGIEEVSLIGERSAWLEATVLYTIDRHPEVRRAIEAAELQPRPGRRYSPEAETRWDEPARKSLDYAEQAAERANKRGPW